MDVHIRGINPEVWRALRVDAVKRGLTMGQLLNLIAREWLEKESD